MVHKGFTKEDVRAAIAKCEMLPRYYILFACYEEEQVDYYVDFITSLNIENIQMLKRRGYFEITFKNGSFIFFTIVGTTRGLRTHEAYYDFMFDEDTIYEVIMPQVNMTYKGV